MVGLVEQGWANQIEVARAFGCSARTVRRHQRRFGAGGLAALGHTDGYPAGRGRLAAARQRLVQRLTARGVGQREIARRIGVSEKAIRKLLRRLGWKAAPPLQSQLSLEAPTANANPSALASLRACVPAGLPTKGADLNLSAFWFARSSSTRWSSPGLACLGRQRPFRVYAENLWQLGPGPLWIAHQPAYALAHGAVAHQTAGGP
jgi:DNA-binding CsgD family transcriptional regulator